MLTQKDAYMIGHEWIDKWNANQLNDYSLLYAENAEEVSSLANRLVHVTNGHLKGKNELIHYWEMIREIYPDYKYILQEVNLYNDDVVVYFTMSALNTNAIAKISVDEQNKIKKTIICHV